MKKVLSTLLVSTLVVSSILSLSACSQLNIVEQPDPVVIMAEKIYPSAIGNYLTDASVKVPAIDAYMKEYNANADPSAVINYDSIKYNKDADYYYVNDNSTDVGMKFRLDQSMSIVSASIYTGTLDQTTKNVYNIVINAIETSGYKTLMTAEDKAIIQHTLNGFNGVAAAKNDVQKIFAGQENFGAKWANNVAEFEIPVKPSELPKPDQSHTLADIEMPTIEIPSITLDTTIIEGQHLDDGTVVKSTDVTNIADKITSATKQIQSVNAYNETTPEGVNSIMGELIANASKREAGKLLAEASMDLAKLQSSSSTSSLDVTKKLTSELQSAYSYFEQQTKPDTQKAQGYTGVMANSSDFVKTVFDSSQLQVDKNATPDIDKARSLLNDAVAAQQKAKETARGTSNQGVMTQKPNTNQGLVFGVQPSNTSSDPFKDGSFIFGNSAAAFVNFTKLPSDANKSLEERLADAQEELSNLNASLTEKKQNRNFMEAEIPFLEATGDYGTANSYRNQIDALNTEISSLETSISKKNAQIKELREKIAEERKENNLK